MSSYCVPCDRSFNNEEALQQHLRDSPAHAPSFDCDECEQSFNSEEALQQHLRDSPVHLQDIETPLDVFFNSFPTFDYNPSLPPAISYASLQSHEGWRRGSVISDVAWNGYQDARCVEWISRCAPKRTTYMVRGRGQFNCVACALSCNWRRAASKNV